jgi:hypothetical protein
MPEAHFSMASLSSVLTKLPVKRLVIAKGRKRIASCRSGTSADTHRQGAADTLAAEGLGQAVLVVDADALVAQAPEVREQLRSRAGAKCLHRPPGRDGRDRSGRGPWGSGSPFEVRFPLVKAATPPRRARVRWSRRGFCGAAWGSRLRRRHRCREPTARADGAHDTSSTEAAGRAR